MKVEDFNQLRHKTWSSAILEGEAPYLMIFFWVIKDGLKELEDQEHNVHPPEN